MHYCSHVVGSGLHVCNLRVSMTAEGEGRRRFSAGSSSGGGDSDVSSRPPSLPVRAIHIFMCCAKRMNVGPRIINPHIFISTAELRRRLPPR
jgi:hypothetical protein